MEWTSSTVCWVVGVVPGSLVLIGGDPIGKSTLLLLQVSTQLSHQGTGPLCQWGGISRLSCGRSVLADIDSEFYLYVETNIKISAQRLKRLSQIF